MLFSEGIDSDLKWPNDVLVSDKKISGILIQTSMEKEIVQYAVTGIGMNVNATSFPEALKGTATSIAMETGSPASRERILASLLLEFEILYGKINEMAWTDLTGELEKHSSYLRGCSVRLQQNEVICEGTTDGLDPYGGLILKTDGEQKVFYAGEIQLCRKK
jgi:BirA family biotin operon repressor/biotin-[acetyl-CoA-carboxylase] ligase